MLEEFVTCFQHALEHSLDERETGQELMKVTQGTRDAVEYALEFHTIAARNGWNKLALKTAFRQGLNAELVKELDCRDEQLSLDALIELTICLDQLCQTNRPALHEPKVPVPGAAAQPMQLRQAQIREEQRERHRREFRSFYCGKGNDLVLQCPLKKPQPSGDIGDSRRRHQMVSSNHARTTHVFVLPVMIEHSGCLLCSQR